MSTLPFRRSELCHFPFDRRWAADECWFGERPTFLAQIACRPRITALVREPDRNHTRRSDAGTRPDGPLDLLRTTWGWEAADGFQFVARPWLLRSGLSNVLVTESRTLLTDSRTLLTA